MSSWRVWYINERGEHRHMTVQAEDAEQAKRIAWDEGHQTSSDYPTQITVAEPA